MCSGSGEVTGSFKNEDPLRKRRPSRKRRHITKTSSKEVGITFVDKDYVHEKATDSKACSDTDLGEDLFHYVVTDVSSVSPSSERNVSFFTLYCG